MNFGYRFVENLVYAYLNISIGKRVSSIGFVDNLSYSDNFAFVITYRDA